MLVKVKIALRTAPAKSLVGLVETRQNPVARRGAGEIQDRANPIDRLFVKGLRRFGCNLRRHGEPDRIDGLRINSAGHRNRVGDAPGQVAVKQTQKFGRPRNRQFRQDHRAGFRALALKNVEHRGRFEVADDLPRIALDRHTGRLAQLPGAGRADGILEHIDRANQPTGKRHAEAISARRRTRAQHS